MAMICHTDPMPSREPHTVTLQGLGMTEPEAAAYEWLLARRPVQPAELVPRHCHDLRSARRLLERLAMKGLVTRSAEGYLASPPNLALSPRLRDQHERLRRAEAVVAELMDSYRESAPHRGVSDVVDVVSDRQAVAQRFSQIQAGAQDEVLAFIRAGVLAVSGEENVEEERALARGVRYRIVAERAVLDRPGFLAEAARLGRDGGARVTAALPGRLLVADRAIAMLPMQPEGAPDVGALLVHASPLLDMLVDLFETYWEVSSPLLPGLATDGVDSLPRTDATILSLFHAGLTDRAVASQLGLSMRTVQRRVRELMDRAGVDTRFRLGVEAVRRGWIGRS